MSKEMASFIMCGFIYIDTNEFTEDAINLSRSQLLPRFVNGVYVWDININLIEVLHPLFNRGADFGGSCCVKKSLKVNDDLNIVWNNLIRSYSWKHSITKYLYEMVIPKFSNIKGRSH